MENNNIIAMHQIFFVSTCRYMQMGLELMMSTAAMPIRVIPVSQPKDIVATPREGGNRLIVVPLPTREPRTKSRAKVWLWRLECLQLTGELPLLPCVLLSDDLVQSYRTLPERLSVNDLRDSFCELLTHPEHAERKSIPNKGRCNLSPLQEKILSGILNGETVNEIANRLDISKQGIFAGRAALMNKLGLMNRMGLTALTDVEVA